MDIENTQSGSLSDNLLKQFGNYDPKLDLADYIYPYLDLLENYENNITVVEAILEVNKNKIIEIFNYNQIEILNISNTNHKTTYSFVTCFVKAYNTLFPAK